jgi:7-keto-8-aminopelargonate synthetase-like enzyme
MRHYTFPKSFISRLADTARASGTYTWNQEVEEYLLSGWVRSNGRRLLMLAGYSYLGPIRNRRLIESARYALESFGAGTHGTRPNCGTISLHTELERLISETNRTEGTLISPSGFQANLSTIAALVGRDDYRAVLMVDEAHSLGVLGKSGFGITEHLDLAAGDIDTITGVLSKAIPGNGGYTSASG